MNCREFDHYWNDRLDAASAGAAAEAAEAHAAVCPSCRARGAGYLALERSLAGLARPPVPEGFADGVLARVPAGPPRRLTWRLRAVIRPVVAWAALFLLTLTVILVVQARLPKGPEPGRVVVTSVPPATEAPAVAPDELGRALADATSATLELAREASAPAARLGGEVLADGLPEPPADLSNLSGGWVPSAGGVWNEVGGRVQAGVRPWTAPTRSAFSFLLGPATGAAPGPGEDAPRSDSPSRPGV